MTEFLIRHFVKDYEHTEEVSVRTQYGTLASVVGIFCNVLLFAAKAVIGLLMHSISVTADAFNNLSDAASSVIGLIGVKMAGKPADREHPFGHGRMEYITALVVSFLVIEEGFTFFKDAIGRIREPQPMEFSVVSVLILLLSVCVKLWMSFFNRRLGKRIDSKVMLATAADASLQSRQFLLTALDFTGWKYVSAELPEGAATLTSLDVIYGGGAGGPRAGHLRAPDARAARFCRPRPRLRAPDG